MIKWEMPENTVSLGLMRSTSYLRFLWMHMKRLAAFPRLMHVISPGNCMDLNPGRRAPVRPETESKLSYASSLPRIVSSIEDSLLSRSVINQCTSFAPLSKQSISAEVRPHTKQKHWALPFRWTEEWLYKPQCYFM